MAPPQYAIDMLRIEGQKLSQQSQKTPEEQAFLDAAVEALLAGRNRLDIIASLMPPGYKLAAAKQNPATRDGSDSDDSDGFDSDDSDDEHLLLDSTNVSTQIPKHLHKLAEVRTGHVWEAQLWVTGVLSNINAVILRPEGYAKPISLVAGRVSAESVDRRCRVKLDPPDGMDSVAEVMTRPTKKKLNERTYHCFARILCFNDQLALNHFKKFDICVDKDAASSIFDCAVYKRTFVGKRPHDDEKPMEVIAGFGKDWYHIPLNKPDGTKIVEPVFDRKVASVNSDCISVKSRLRLDIGSDMRYPLNNDPVMYWKGNKRPGDGSRQNVPDPDHSDGDGNEGKKRKRNTGEDQEQAPNALGRARRRIRGGVSEA